MKSSAFIIELGIYAIICLVISVLFQQFILQDAHLPFLIIEIFVFVVGSFIVHSLAQKAAKNENKYVFSRLTMGNTFIKLFLLVGMVVIYRVVFPQLTIDFIWPFIISYIAFTIFETKYLLKLAKS